MTKITIHRALAELKTIDKRIEKQLTNLKTVDGYQKGGKVAKQYTIEEYEKAAKADTQSVIDLINRKQLIKTKIAESNVTTKVKIAGKEYTVSEAINFRATVLLKQKLVNTIRNQYKTSVAELDRVNANVEKNAITIAQSALNRENVKIEDTDAVNITKPYVEANEWHLCNPLNAEQWCKDKENEIFEFETEVDAVLSESNSLTTIEL